MLTWMQRHKKYLVVTIWISVIAFVGAGFVGWGSYDFNLDRSNSVAKVGDEKISMEEFNLKYNELFNYKNNLSNGKYTQEQAIKENLDMLAVDELIQEKLLLSYAKNLGLRVSDEEVALNLASQEIFHNSSGKFDKNLYYNILSRNNLSTKAYEKSIHDELLLKKINAILIPKVKDEELQMFASSFLMQDRLKIQAVYVNPKDIIINEDELKQSWEKNKQLFKTQENYQLQTYFIKLDDGKVDDETLKKYYNENKNNYKDFSGKILSFEQSKAKLEKDYKIANLKNKANQSYVALRKNELNFDQNITIDEADIYYPIQNIKNGKEGDFIKPFQYKDGFMIAKIMKINPIQTKTFEQAKKEASEIYVKEKTKIALEEKAKNTLNNFNGIDIGSFSRDSIRNDKIDDKIMNDAEFGEFLMSVFDSNQKKSYVIFNDKAIVYEIVGQKLSNEEKEQIYKVIVEQSALGFKQALLKEELLKKLLQIYPIQRYYKGNTN